MIFPIATTNGRAMPITPMAFLRSRYESTSELLGVWGGGMGQHLSGGEWKNAGLRFRREAICESAMFIVIPPPPLLRSQKHYQNTSLKMGGPKVLKEDLKKRHYYQI